MAYLARKRPMIDSPASGSFEIIVELEPEVPSDESCCVWVQCSPCDVELFFDSHRGLLECPSCGNSSTPGEMSHMADRYISAIRDRFPVASIDRKRGGIWDLIVSFLRPGTQKT